MRLPQSTDYNEAVQSPAHCFLDDELRGGRPVCGPLGLPRAHAGNFADVYQIDCPDTGRSWAVKCFTRPTEGLHRRYQAVSDHLDAARLPFGVEFRYLDEGIRVRGQVYPVLKMRWVEGLTLNEFIRQHLDKTPVLERLTEMWVKLARQLRAARIAHGDLQHGNVLLVESDRAGKLRLRLIDYDGMYVPALADSPSGESGHPNYQHPERLRDGTYGPETDRFAHLVIYTALRALAAIGPTLWARHDNGENLLFREQDFKEPGRSGLWRELWDGRDAAVSALAGHLLLASQGSLDAVPLLDALGAPGDPPELDAEQRQQVKALLASSPAPWWVASGLAPARAVPLDAEALAVAELLAADPEPTPTAAAPAEEGPALLTPGGGWKLDRQVRLFCVARAGREELVDAAAGDLEGGRFAVAAADPDSVHAGLWSRLLVEDFVDSDREQPAAWSAWLPPVQLKWTAAVAETNEPLRKDPQHEARATFLGLVLHGRRWLERRRWSAIAVGDCCLFQVRDGLLLRTFPLSGAPAFAAAPHEIGARTSFEPVLRKHEVRAEGDWAEGDQFWLLTRSLARWFLEQVDAWQRPWDALEALLRKQAAERAFRNWIAELRERGAVEGDAIALGVCL